MNESWSSLASRAGLTLTETRHTQLVRYLELLEAANARMNLTRITDRAAAELHHIADALTLLPHLPCGPHRLADVGSGGGVPGVPLAIVRPDARVVLIESTGKKAAFLRSVTAELGLGNVTVLPARAEDAGHSDERETFDVAVARAVATLDWLAEWCLPLVKKGGKVLAMKGPKVHDELAAARAAIKLLGGAEPILHPVDLPGTDQRLIVELPKPGKTNPRYPRPATQAKGKSLSEPRKR